MVSMVFHVFLNKKCKVENFPGMNGSQFPTYVVYTPTYTVKEHDPPACGVRLLHFNGFELILFGCLMVSMVFHVFIGKKCKVENFPGMNGSQSPTNVFCFCFCRWLPSVLFRSVPSLGLTLFFRTLLLRGGFEASFLLGIAAPWESILLRVAGVASSSPASLRRVRPFEGCVGEGGRDSRRNWWKW